jgi:hypothetical protein
LTQQRTEPYTLIMSGTSPNLLAGTPTSYQAYRNQLAVDMMRDLRVPYMQVRPDYAELHPMQVRLDGGPDDWGAV